jgi:predicted DNA-binding helix-hairpin-helix protein
MVPTPPLPTHLPSLSLTPSLALQGDAFPSEITVAELKQLIRMQKLGVERAEATLKTLDSEVG